MIVLMAAFNAFSHGTQDLYPTFLQQQHHFDTHLTGTLTAIMNVGAIVGGIGFGIWSERIGRKRAIIIASLLALPVIPLWAFASTPLLLGDRRLPDAGRGPGRVGHRPGPPQRALARRRARAVPRLRLSARQSAHVAATPCSRPRSPRATATITASLWRSSAASMAVVIAIWTALGPERKHADFIADANSRTSSGSKLRRDAR